MGESSRATPTSAEEGENQEEATEETALNAADDIDESNFSNGATSPTWKKRKVVRNEAFKEQARVRYARIVKSM